MKNSANFFHYLLPLLVGQLFLLSMSGQFNSLWGWLSLPVVALVAYFAGRYMPSASEETEPSQESAPLPQALTNEFDALTGLVSRLSFRKQLATELLHSHQQRQPLTLLYLDLDNFKYVNEKHGYEIGDKLLKSVARRLTYLVNRQVKGTSAGPWLARLSGDEFAIVLPQYSTTQAEPIVHKIRELFLEGFHFELGAFPISASIGIASFPLDGHTVTQLVSNAEMAMNQAKSSGGNRHKIYSYHLARIARRHHLIEQELKHADLDEEFSLHYMPIVDRQGKVHSCEALLRWHSANLGPVYPDEFIPIAESAGLFRKIDLWVARQAMADYAALQQLFSPEVTLAINVSSAELSSRSFYAALIQTAQQLAVPATGIELEITETFAKEHSEAVLDRLAKLQSKGFSIAIDDFGSGYTSLIQMVDFPVDRVKFDKSLVERLCGEHKEQMLSSLVHLCHQQQITIVAEGVETEAQKQSLLDAGVDCLQGYLFGKPMPLSELEVWASKQSVNTKRKYPKLPQRRILIGHEDFASPAQKRFEPLQQDAKAYQGFQLS